MDRHRAMEFYHRAVNLLALLLFAAAQFGCTTAREPAPDSEEAMRQMAAKPQSEPTPAPKAQFR